MSYYGIRKNRIAIHHALTDFINQAGVQASTNYEKKRNSKI